MTKKLSKAKAGRVGGRATLARHGVEHFRAIGKLGFAALARRLGYVGGSRLGALQYLTAKGKVPTGPVVSTEEFERMFEAIIAATEEPEP
jgi:hypothetical protein